MLKNTCDMVIIIMKIGFITWTTASNDGVVFTLMFTFVFLCGVIEG